MNFSKTETFIDNGYLIAGRDQWDDWVAAFGADYTSVVTKIQYSTVNTPLGPVDIAWLSQIANVCGWRVKDWDNAGWAIYEKIPPDDPPPPPPAANQPPTARFSWPSTAYEGELVEVTDQSFDSDGEIVDRDWHLTPSSNTSADLGDTGGSVRFNAAGTYTLELTVTDNDGADDSETKTITVLQPIPTARIGVSGTLKENRKVVLDSSGSKSAESYPIDHRLDEWVIIPVSGGAAEDIKTRVQVGTKKELLFKKTGTYRVGLRVHNSLCASEWTYQNIVIVPDDPPAANFVTPAIIFRNPADASYASICINDRSFSLDGDIVSERVWKYKFDSNNNGSFLDETWTILDEGNNIDPVLRNNHVGKYLFSLEIRESFGQETIPEFITDDDCKTAETTTKPDNQKITEIKNIAPVSSFVARTRPKADLIFSVGDIDPGKTGNICDQLNNSVIPKLLANNINPKITVFDSGFFTGNIVNDYSFEDIGTYWNDTAGLYHNAVPTQDLKRTGKYALGIYSFGSYYSYGQSQRLQGWAQGDSIKVSAHVNIPIYVKGVFKIDLYGLDTNKAVVFNPVCISRTGVTSGYTFLESPSFVIPDTVDTLHVRVFSEDNPQMQWAVDDISVKVSKNAADPNISVIGTGKFAGNLVLDPSFTDTGVISINSRPWTAKSPIYVCARTSWEAATGKKSLLIEEFSSRDQSIGVTQQLITGWAPGDRLRLSASVMVTRYIQGNFQMNLLGYDSSEKLVFSSPGYSYTPSVTGDWTRLTVTENIPSNVSSLHIRIWATGYPKMTMFVDDVEVINKTHEPIDQILNNVNWRDGSTKFLVNLNDYPSFSDSSEANAFAGQLASGSIHYTVIGSEANKAEAENIIALNANNGSFYYNTDFGAALNSLGDYVVNKTLGTDGGSVQYVLLEDTIQCTPIYSDYENDPKWLDSWYYAHDPNYVDNSNGTSFYHLQTLSNPITAFDKCGKYDITYKAMDDPTKGDALFNNYRLWSNPTPTSIVVHRRPIADFTVMAGTLSITDLSFDPDFQFRRPDKGIVEWLWKWRKTTSPAWTTGKPTGISELGDYVIHLEVKDIYGAWSDPVEKTITVANLQKPPVANFNWTPSLVYEGDNLTLNNLSYDPDGDPLTYQWTIFNPLGVTTTFSTKNVILNNVLSGTYWVTLRAWDPGGLTDVTTKSIFVNVLTVTGKVNHTPEWNANRINYNRSVSGTEDSPRGYNVFWAGETFVLEADTTDTGSSATKPQSVTVRLLANGATAALSGNAANTRWAGSMWRDDFERLPDGNYTFRFTATYSNGVVKTGDVQVMISGTWQDYFNFHRSW